jgi:prepilin-type N-terminal cleavage/methylation domain-containing protein
MVDAIDNRGCALLRRRGFTLVELLVVIGIIALLISILLPSLSAAREQGKSVQCLSNLRQLSQAAVMYAGRFNSYVIPGYADTAMAVTGNGQQADAENYATMMMNENLLSGPKPALGTNTELLWCMDQQ